MLHSAYSHEVCRKWMVNLPTKDQIIYPVFVVDQEEAYQEIASMPGVARYGYKNIVAHLEPLVNKLKLQSVLVFGILSDDNQKDEQGTYAGTLDEQLEGPVHKAIASIKKAFPKLMVIADVCICAYTSHGHCAVLKDNNIDNQKSIERLGQVAVSYARKGADMVAPSDMMDNRVQEIKNQLKQHGFSRIPVMSYSAKFASAYYGPFRDVCKSTPLNFDRQSYQLPVDSTQLAIQAVERDLKEGTDFIIVKPLGQYLDIAAMIKQKFPQAILAGYQVSGEYAMIKFAAMNKACDYKKMIMEQLRCFKRAGIDVVITYYAPEILEWLSEQ